MYRKLLLPFLLLFFTSSIFSQDLKIYGKITTNKLEPLAFVTVQVKNQQFGTLTKEDGTYELSVHPGKYDLIVTMIGYKPQVININVREDYLQNIIMEEDESANLEEVVVRVKSKDRAEEIMRNLIRNKENIAQAALPYSVKVYIKAVQQDSGFNRKKDATITLPDTDIEGMAMAEVSLKLDYESDSRMKEERFGVKRNANNNNRLYYLSTTEGNFNFYNNLVKVPSISEMSFLSPVSYSGLVAYKFKTINIERRGTHRIYTISVKPRLLSNATVEGEITISDSAWAILHTRFTFPKYHLVNYDFFEVEQEYGVVKDSVWVLKRQQFTYYNSSNKEKLSGKTVVTYSDYEINKNFDKKYFGLEVSATAQKAYEQDNNFWETVRTEPLTEKEIKFVRVNDSMRIVTTSERYLDSIDRVINKITWKKLVITGQNFHNRKKERMWDFPSILSLYQPFAFGGGRFRPSFYYAKTSPSKKNFSLYTDLSYGFRNKDINGTIQARRMYNPFNRGIWGVSMGRNFDFIYAGDAWINMLKRSNFYLNNYVAGNHQIEIFNGFTMFTEMEIAFRRSVSNYKTGKVVDSLFGSILDNNQAVPFDPYNALYGKLEFWYTPFQKFIREPNQKIILGSKWPTVYTSLRKGIPGLMNSKVNFDYLEFGMFQRIDVGLLGYSRYRIKTGSYLNQKDLRLIDYKFMRRGDPILFMNPDEAFQSLDSTFPIFNRFFEGHYVHEFNGALLNKIPLLKKLQLREIGGAGFLVVPERNLRYAELFAGIERIFKWPFDPLAKFKLGVYVVGSAANYGNNPIQFKVGLTTWDKRRGRWH